MKADTGYWLVRKAIAITAYFGGLRMVECMELQLEKITRGADGFTVTPTRAKQRSDKNSTKFLVPQVGGYADQLANYLEKVKNNQLDAFTGKVWYTGQKISPALTMMSMGKTLCQKFHMKSRPF